MSVSKTLEAACAHSHERAHTYAALGAYEPIYISSFPLSQLIIEERYKRGGRLFLRFMRAHQKRCDEDSSQREVGNLTAVLLESAASAFLISASLCPELQVQFLGVVRCGKCAAKRKRVPATCLTLQNVTTDNNAVPRIPARNESIFLDHIIR